MTSKRSRPSAKSRSKGRVSPHNSAAPVRKSSAKLGPSQKAPDFRFTRVSKRGRKPKVRVSELYNRAYDLRLIFQSNLSKLNWKELVAARTEKDLEQALNNAFDRAKEILLCKPGLLLSVLCDRQFPQKDRDAQEQFIADSLAALGQVSIRRSRDIVQRDRSARKKRGKILRREFYIECSCKYEGPAYKDACPQCGAEVSYLDFASGFAMRV